MSTFDGFWNISMENASIYKQFRKSEQLGNTSKVGRFLSNPYKYLNAIGYRLFFYSKTKKGKLATAKTFFGAEMNLILPAGTDIYLTGCKSHESEIRLAKFLMNTLKAGDTFFDVGAHFGYFSLLGSKLVGANGKVFSFEASKSTFKILKENTEKYPNIEIHNNAISNEKSNLSFYEFPVLYSEYNSLKIGQFENTDWFKNNQPQKIEIEGITLSDFSESKTIQPKVIKIDVEGAEFLVIDGSKNLLQRQSPKVIIEFLNSERKNEAHLKAQKLLNDLGYTAFKINEAGEAESCENIETYLNINNLDSDNIIFQK